MKAVDNEIYMLATEGRLLQGADGGFGFDASGLAELDEADIEAHFPLGSIADGTLLVLKAGSELAVRFEGAPLRSLLASARSELDYARLSRAAQLAVWHEQHRFCGRCGSPLVQHAQDLAKSCESCGLSQYPRISPCIIVLVTRGERCLLAHAPHYPPGRYSTLAGFIEAGETAEAAVAREIREEVGIEVQNIRYFKSQSWPFPHALMLGFFADYRAGDLTPDGIEILDARWFERDELPDLPPSFAISAHLIEAWRRGDAG